MSIFFPCTLDDNINPLKGELQADVKKTILYFSHSSIKNNNNNNNDN